MLLEKKYPMKSIYFVLSVFVFLTSCSSKTLIQSSPSGADVYVNNQKKGQTPYKYKDTKIVGSSTDITIKKEGYDDFNTALVRDERVDVGAIIGGVFLLVPFLWTMQYDKGHYYELTEGNSTSRSVETNSGQASSSTDELIKVKNMFELGIINNEEYSAIKAKILNDEYDYTNSIADQITKLNQLLNSDLITQEEFTAKKNSLINGK
jgi:hypothetical protein